MHQFFFISIIYGGDFVTMKIYSRETRTCRADWKAILAVSSWSSPATHGELTFPGGTWWATTYTYCPSVMCNSCAVNIKSRMNFAEPHRITTETKRTTIALNDRYRRSFQRDKMLVKYCRGWSIFGEEIN